MIVHDILIDDPFTASGDLNVTDTNSQNIQAILIAQEGQFYVWPSLGIDIRKYLKSPETFTGFKARVIEELTKDNYSLSNFELVSQAGDVTIEIDAIKLK